MTRERVLDDGELVEVWRAAEVVGDPWEPIVKLLILTAQRRLEVGEISWNELDFGRRLWTLPAERAKNGRSHEVPLTDTAMGLLSAVPRLDGSPFVFPSREHRPVSGWSFAKRMLDAAIGSMRRRLFSFQRPLKLRHAEIKELLFSFNKIWAAETVSAAAGHGFSDDPSR